MPHFDLKLRWMSRRSGDDPEASPQIPALAKLEKAPKMKAVWRQGATDVIFHNGSWAQVRTEASEWHLIHEIGRSTRAAIHRRPES